MHEVDAICDRVLMLRDGQLALDQSMAELQDSKSLMLRTSKTEQPLASYLKRLPQIASVEDSNSDDAFMHFAIQLHANVATDTATNNIAQCVLKAGAKLYQLQVTPRDLDSVFREVNDRGD